MTVVGIVALLLQYKCDGRPGFTGPGDTLRLAHALRDPSLGLNEGMTVISTLPKEKVLGLIPTSDFKEIHCTDRDRYKTGHVDHLHLARLLDEQLDQSLSGARVFHSFIGYEEDYPWRKTLEKSPAGREYTRQRIDSSMPKKSHMFHSKWEPPKGSRSLESVIAAFIRREPTSPDRNTPYWFYDIVRNCAMERGYKILWCGFVNSFTPQPGEDVMPGTGSFIQQIRQLASSATCAVGWNSGGLDQAAAAGLPVLRIGEFQRLQNWGKFYNSYLATATCVGLEPRSPEVVQFDRDKVNNSLTAFLANRDLFEVPRHVIIPAAQTLHSNRERLVAQLNENEIHWPNTQSA